MLTQANCFNKSFLVENEKKGTASFGLCQSQKYLGMILDPKVTLEEYYEKVLSEVKWICLGICLGI